MNDARRLLRAKGFVRFSQCASPIEQIRLRSSLRDRQRANGDKNMNIYHRRACTLLDWHFNRIRGPRCGSEKVYYLKREVTCLLSGRGVHCCGLLLAIYGRCNVKCVNEMKLKPLSDVHKLGLLRLNAARERYCLLQKFNEAGLRFIMFFFGLLKHFLDYSSPCRDPFYVIFRITEAFQRCKCN